MIRNKRIKLLILTLLLLALGNVLFVACARPGTSGTANTANQGNSQSAAPATGGTATAPATGSTATATAPATSGSASTTVHMGTSNFVQTTVTISKGSSITLMDDTAVPHIINNGSWNGNTPKPATEAGAPTVNVQFAGSDSKQIGPFNTAGTFHLYCTIHPGMNLTVTVH